MTRNNENAKQLRKSQTKTESLLWSVLRARQLCNLKFRRQFPIGPFNVDFACCQRRLVVEVDGDYHDLVAEADLAREEFIREQGWDIIRFSNEEVEDNPVAVGVAIARSLGLEFEFNKRKGTGSGNKA